MDEGWRRLKSKTRTRMRIRTRRRTTMQDIRTNT